MKFRIVAVLAVALVVICSAGLQAGQIASHIYTALQMRGHLSPACRSIVDTNLDAYLAGAQGPDITGVVQHGLGRLSTMPVPTVGEESHYDHTGELAANIVFSAKKPAEQAFALGWITHYFNDKHVHALVNQYGGYYKVAGPYHKVLEQLESKHVYASKSSVVTKALATSCPADLGPDFAWFLIQGYSLTFPTNELYQANKKIGIEGYYDTTRGEHFCGQFRRASSWCLDAAKDFHAAHENGDGKHTWTQSLVPAFPQMPTKAQYELMLKPLLIDVKPQPGRLLVTAIVNDNRLYGRFLQEWDKAAAAAAADSASALSAACTLIETKDAAGRKSALARLKSALPNINLDQPSASFSASSLDPGNVQAKEVFLELRTADKPKEKKTGKVSISSMKPGGYADGKTGIVTFSMPVESKAACTLQVKLIPNAKLKGWDYMEYGGSAKAAEGEKTVMVGDVFELTFNVPERYAGKGSSRRYVLMPSNAKIEAEDAMLIQGSLENEKFRYDVAPIEESFSGSKLTTKLQITNGWSDKLLGSAKVAVVCFAPGQGDKDLSGLMKETDKALNAAGDAMDALREEMDLNDEQMEKLDKIMEDYAAELNKNKKLSEDQKQQMIEAKAEQEMKRINAASEERLAADKRLNDFSAMGDAPYSDAKPVFVQGAMVSVTVPSGWERDGEKQGRCFATRSVSRESLATKYLSAKSTFSATLTNDIASKNRLVSNASKNGASRAISVAGFKGTLYENAKDAQQDWTSSKKDSLAGGSTYRAHLYGSAVLEKGQMLMTIDYSMEIEAQRSVDDKGDVVYDGLPEAKKEKDRVTGEITSMISSMKLSSN